VSGDNLQEPRAFRVVIDARVISGLSGGIESVIIGLVGGLSRLDDGPEDFVVLAYEGHDDWIRPHLGGMVRLVHVLQARDRSEGSRRRLKTLLPPLARLWSNRPEALIRSSTPPPSDGTIERLNADVMHFTSQAGFKTSVPSLYHPHDLQHVHLPEFFTARQRHWRDDWYGALIQQASMVPVASTWTKRDVETHFSTPPGKVVVVPLAPPTAEYRDPSEAAVEEAMRRLVIPPAFAMYPAQTWKHKNHVNLLDALALLRERDGLVVPLVAPGRQSEAFPALARHAERLGIADQVRWLGFVSADDLQCLYRRARVVVIPSRFEAASAPLWEAFRAGIPTACSNVTSLPEQAGDASLIFDPDDVPAIADAIRRLWTDEDLRTTLIQRGYERVRPLSWDRTARTFRAHYRRIGRRTLSHEDRALLATHPNI
jgi:glycosyltransferase involved in cell wall biosynthesis